MLVNESERTSDKAYSAIGCLEITKKAKKARHTACRQYWTRDAERAIRVWLVRLRSKHPTQAVERVLISFRRRTGQFSNKNEDKNSLDWVKSSH